MARMRRLQENPLVRVTPVVDSSAYDAALQAIRGTRDAASWEAIARGWAERFGVDPNLPPRERTMAINKAIARRGGIGGGWRARRERVPGDDDE